MEHKRFTRHSDEVINQILSLFDSGDRSKDISLNSKEEFGYKIKQSTISTILRRYGRNPKDNTYRIRKKRRKRPEG